MFWSKIWFFLVAIVAAVALTLALLMPKPAERATVNTERTRLARACSVTEILMRDFARTRIQLASDTARAESGLDTVLAQASKGEIVSAESYSTAKKILTELDFGTKREGNEDVPYRPDLVLALDQSGRVVARSGIDETRYGDSLAGVHLIDDALDGFLRDDLWITGGKLMLVAGSPVVTRNLDWAGGVVVGEEVDKDFATELGRRLDVQLTFYAAGQAVATSDPVEIHQEVLAHAEAFEGSEPGRDCAELEPFSVTSGDHAYWVQLARLPGEAGQLGSFYAVHIPQEKAIGFSGTISAVKKDDLSFSSFPWIKVGILFLLMVGVGMGLMVFESDRPLRRLSADSVKLAKGESERLAEEQHKGKIGSIARSVNIAIDKLSREAKAAKKDLDNLLGPLPDAVGSATALPAAAPLGPPAAAFTPPPPSEFRFSGGVAPGGAPQAPASGAAFDLAAPGPAPTNDRIPPPAVALPASARPSPAKPKPPTPAVRRNTPPPMPPGPSAIADDILAGAATKPASPKALADDDEEDTRVAGAEPPTAVGVVMGATSDDPNQFRAVFDEFVALKKKCGESTDSLTYDRFLAKLKSNRDALIAKHGCKAVKFQVYVKDNKAALKASPVR